MSTLGPLHLPHSGRGGGIGRRCFSWGWRYHWNHLKPVPHGLLLSRRRAEGGRSQPGWGEEYGRIPAGNAGFHWRGGWTPWGRRARVCVYTWGLCAHVHVCVCTWGVCVHRCVPVHILCHVHVCARVFVCTHGCVHTRLCMHVCARGSVCVRACVHISVCACVSSRVCAWRLYADTCACMCKLRLCVHRHLSLYSHWRVCSHTCLRSHTRVSV